MVRAQRQPAALPPVVSTTGAASWGQWPSKVRTLQVDAANDMLGVFSRYVAAIGTASDAQALGHAQWTLVAEWSACMENIGKNWVGMAQLMPADVWSAFGWRLKAAARTSADGDTVGAPPDLLEQSKLGMEMLLRPWMPAPDLDHTEEFVA